MFRKGNVLLLLTRSETFFKVYSKVISVSSVTLPTSLVIKEWSSERFKGFSFLNYNPLWSLTFAITFDAITGWDNIF